MNNVSFSLLKLIVEYVYKGCVNIDHTELQKFLQTARALKISGLVNYGEEEPAPAAAAVSRKIVAPPKLTSHKPVAIAGQKRNLTDAAATPIPSKKVHRKEAPASNRPPKQRHHEPIEAPSAPDEMQAAYLSLELEVETPEENAGEDGDEVENIPFMPGMMFDKRLTLCNTRSIPTNGVYM